MRLRLAIVIGRLVRWLARARGGGSALPGRIARLIEPSLLAKTIGVLPTVVFVTGSNGKSTTTGMLVAILRAHGLNVFTNPAGSNLPQGLASAVLADVDGSGRIRADLAVLEVDEAYGPMISAELTPDHLVVTNLQVDQLNRFGEPERVWAMIDTVARRTRSTLIVNAKESALLSLGNQLPPGAQVHTIDVANSVVDAEPHGLVEARIVTEEPRFTVAPELTISRVDGREVDVTSAGTQYSFSTPDRGLHYAVDGALALQAARVLYPSCDWQVATRALSTMPPVYGRGEVVTFRGVDFQLIMQKNLPSMQVNLSTISEQPETLWVAVDEGTPDPSWLFDLDLGALQRVDVLSGSKAWQWATFLTYRGVPWGEIIEDTKEAMVSLAERAGSGAVTAIVNYEQMMKVRRIAGYLDLEGGQ